MDLHAHKATRDPEVISLSPQEVAILRAFVDRGEDVTLTRAELYREAWGYQREPRGRALDYAIRRLREKLGATASTGPVLGTVRGVGYRLCWGPATSVLVAVPRRVMAAPAPQTPLLARDELVGEALKILEEPGALLSVVGPGGIGKSSVAEAIIAHLPKASTTWVDLEAAPVGGAAAAIERAFFGQREDTVPLAERLSRRGALSDGEMLLVLDGGERHTDELGALLGTLLGPRMQVLLTTRERLLLRQEHVLPVPPLSNEDAFILLQRVARQRGMSSDIDPAQAEPLLAQLDGLPLAVELAASALRGRPPGVFAQALADGRPLRSRERDRDARHASMEAVVRSSLVRLEPELQQALQDLCALQGNFGAVGAGWALGVDPLEAEDIIERLLDCSMLHVVSTPESFRYRVLRPTRSAMLSARGAPEVALARLRERFDALGRADVVRTIGRGGSALGATLKMHIEDVLIAFHHARPAPPGLALLALLTIWHTGPWEAVRELGRAVLHGHTPADPLSAMAMVHAATHAGDLEQLATLLETFPEGQPGLTRLVELKRITGPLADAGTAEKDARALVAEARGAEDRYVEARAAEALGSALLQRGAIEDAESAFRRYLEAAELDDNLDNQVSAWSRLGEVAFYRTQVEEAIQRIENARSLAGLEHRYAGTLVSNLGLLHLQQGDLEAAAAAVQQGIELARRAGALSQVALSLANLSEIFTALGKDREARETATQAVELCMRHLAVAGSADRSWAHLAMIHCEAGEFEEAAAVRHRWQARFGISTAPSTQAILEAMEAWIEAGAGDHARARSRLVDDDGVAPLPSAHLMPRAAISRHYFAGRAWLLMGEPGTAFAEVEAARVRMENQRLTPFLVARIDRLAEMAEAAGAGVSTS